MKSNIGNKIRKVRELKGFTQDYMASPTRNVSKSLQQNRE